MGKKLAIRGHSTRGKEVIELLEMLGGKNCFHLHGLFSEHAYYFIGGPRNDEIRAGEYMFDEYAVLQMIDDMYFFTLEEFLEKYPYKIRDKVIDDSGESGIIIEMKWDEEIIYKVDFGTECYYFTSDFLRPYKEANANELKPTDNVDDAHYISEYKTIGQGTYAIKIADGYKFDSVDENGNIIVKAFKPKSRYPKTYDDCCDMLNADEFVGYELMTNFPKLINARNAYWKIAGEELGLGKPWEPDWSNNDETKFCIYTTQNIISLDMFGVDNRILAFPTEEMRDAFYKNFEDLIERCKVLL